MICCITRYKDTNLKAIHNNFMLVNISFRLYYQIQRYKFESNSQLLLHLLLRWCSCITRYKDTNLKAIHNKEAHSSNQWLVVLPDTKIQIWKQFTTAGNTQITERALYYQIQRYKFASNSQPNHCACCCENSCITRYKDTNLKAIHNGTGKGSIPCQVVLPDTKIQIWKQFTTNW